MIRLLLRPRWLALLVVVLLLAGLFIGLGRWQLRRLDQRQASNARIEARLAEPQVAFSAVVVAAAGGDEVAYRRVSVDGRYDPDRELLLRSRSFRGEPGRHLLTPLLLADGRALLVNRGWLPLPLDATPVDEAAPPLEVSLVGRIFPEQDPPSGPLVPRDPPEGPLDVSYYIDTDRFAAQFPYDLEPWYLELESQTPPQPGELPLPPPPPELTEGPHLAYALQWFSFAVIALVGYGVLVRRELRVVADRTGP